MNFLKPKFWSKKNSLISLLLLPVSFFVQILIILKRNITNQKKFKIPIICVGNIYLGGTGKTPLSIMISKELSIKGLNPAIIKKYYPEHHDEHLMINKDTNNLFLSSKRSEAIQAAINKNYTSIILDDGFQDFSIKKNLNIVCFNSRQLIGNGMTLPSGPLRESISEIKRAQIVIINGLKNQPFENRILNISNKIKIYYSKYTLLNKEQFVNKKLFAFAGIGNPNNFFSLLVENNLDLQKSLAFPDHYQFTKSEIKKMIDTSKQNNYELVTTEKDVNRISSFGFKNIKYLKTELQIYERDKFMKEISKYL